MFVKAVIETEKTEKGFASMTVIQGDMAIIGEGETFEEAVYNCKANVIKVFFPNDFETTGVEIANTILFTFRVREVSGA
jgi:hypothetical protein